MSPASPGAVEDFDSASAKLESLGFNVRESAHARSHDHYLAGTDIERAGDFNRFLNDRSIRAIIASRGGYGCSRLLPLLDYKAVENSRPIIIGGSDLTTLLWTIHQRTGLVTFFGPMALQIGVNIDDFSLDFLLNMLAGGCSGTVRWPDDYQPYSIRPGTAGGRLIGGCLSLIVSLLGTEYFGDIDGRILFLEEVGEEPFRIDRMLTHLRNAGVLNRISGLLLGDFYQCWPGSNDPFTLTEIVEQVLGEVDIPVMAGLPFGHGAVKMTMPLGVEVSMNAGRGILEFLEAGVSVEET